MKVTIMYCNSFDGGDGWTFHPVTVTIVDTCPKCGRPRGKPYSTNQCEDGEWYNVDQWHNECGHIDYYEDVWHEANGVPITQEHNP